MITDKHPDVAEHQAVYEALERYAVESGTANIDELKKAFHEKAVMNGVNGDGSYVFGPIENLYNVCRELGPTPGAKSHIDVLDIAGNIAVGRVVTESWHGQDFVDYHELVKENGEWKIIAKIYSTF